MHIPDLDDLILDDGGDGLVEEWARCRLSQGPWSTLAFLVRTRRDPEAPWEGPFLWLHRYQKTAQGWKLVSRFHTTERDQLERLVHTLDDWKARFFPDPSKPPHSR